MDDLIKLAARPIAFAGSTVILIGLVYLGIQLKDGLRGGGGELTKALAMISAGGVVAAFAALYGA